MVEIKRLIARAKYRATAISREKDITRNKGKSITRVKVLMQNRSNPRKRAKTRVKAGSKLSIKPEAKPETEN